MHNLKLKKKLVQVGVKRNNSHTKRTLFLLQLVKATWNTDTFTYVFLYLLSIQCVCVYSATAKLR